VNSVVIIFVMMVFAVLVGVLLVSALVMFKRGLWPQRYGDEPHCRHCGYLLIGIDAKRCPECGTALLPNNIVFGERHRQLGMAAIGAAILLIPGILLVSLIVHGISWYHFKPTYFVIHDLQSNGAIALQAMNELDRREMAGGLSNKYEQRLIELGLAQQATNATGTFPSWAIEFAEKQFQAGKLTDAQKQRLFRQSVQLTLSTPSIVALGNDVPFQVSVASRVTIPHLYVKIIEWESVSIDDRIVMSGPSGSSGFSGLGGSGSSANGVPCKQPGRHRLIVVPRIELYQGNGNMGPPVYSEDRSLTAWFTVG